MFELVNEPHDLDVTLWAGTVQAAIDAIRGAGATSQTILIPGTEWTHLDAWSDGSDDALLVSCRGIVARGADSSARAVVLSQTGQRPPRWSGAAEDYRVLREPFS
jgi:hypothetical protein